ncbi:MAG: rhodanese-like domain-containing protein [Burkholderiales bacterium]
MSDENGVPAIRKLAAERAKQQGLTYAGAVTPNEAYELMRAGARLVDVRTKPEMQYVGRVPGSVPVEWQTYPGNVQNARFLEQLADAVEPGETLLFICRSGARSHSAAAVAAQAGWPDSYNVLEGFEGAKDADQHRGTLGGWRKAGLPWVQG